MGLAAPLRRCCRLSPASLRASPLLLLALLPLLAGLSLGSSAAGPKASARAAPPGCAFIAATRPRQYVAHRLGEGQTVELDGRLEEEAWSEVGWAEDFVDISTAATPPLRTRVKLRWDEETLYVGAWLEEPQVAANISSTCHCINASADQVIFHDNDFEVFVDADGSTHNYKELEVNALAASWDLLLSRSYEDGGGENSSRLFGDAGWDMMAPRAAGRAAAWSDGRVNKPGSAPSFWSVELALPLRKLAELTRAALPGSARAPKPHFWRINFSRVEWGMVVVDGRYQKRPSCRTCPVPGAPAEDNWVWSAQGAVAMHKPERWGFLQFEDSHVNATRAAPVDEWPVRACAAALYYAQKSYAAGEGAGGYAARVEQLRKYTETFEALDGSCLGGKEASIELGEGGRSYTAVVEEAAETTHERLLGSVNEQRLMRVERVARL